MSHNSVTILSRLKYLWAMPSFHMIVLSFIIYVVFFFFQISG